MTSEQNRPQRPLRERTGFDGAAGLQAVEQMLTVQQRAELRNDLAEIAQRRRRAEDTSHSLWLR